jgi:TonB family protein
MKAHLLASLALVLAARGSVRADERPLSAAEVRKVVESKMGEVKACMKQHAPDGPTGRVVVHYVILPSGRVDRPTVQESSTGNKALDGCITAIFPKLQFPPPRGGAVLEELYPFTFAPPKDPPKPQASAPQDAKTREQIQATIQGRMKEVQDCYEKARASEPDLEGVVVVEMTVDKDGKVQKTSKLESTTKHDPVDACILAAVGKWQFPKPEGGGNVVIAYPFKLQRGSKSDRKGAP